MKDGYIHAGITRTSEAKASNRIAIRRYIPHAEHRSKGFDIALLELAADITSSKARPIPILTPDLLALSAPGKAARLTGWGMDEKDDFPDQLRRLDAPISTRKYDDWNLAFGGPTGGTLQGSCSGDSGGPLAVRDATGAGWLLAGVVHGGVGECGENPGIYTRVTCFHDWILRNTGGVTALARQTPGKAYLIPPPVRSASRALLPDFSTFQRFFDPMGRAGKGRVPVPAFRISGE